MKLAHRSPQDPAYWASWAISHWSTMAVSGALCALVGMYPFSHSSASLLLVFYWLVAAVRSSQPGSTQSLNDHALHMALITGKPLTVKLK